MTQQNAEFVLKTFFSLSNILADRSQGIALTKKISMQKAQSFTGLPPIPPNLLATETRQFTEVSEMNELFKGRADVRFIQKLPGGVSVKSRLTSIGTMRIQQLCWSGQLIVEAGTAKNQTALILPQPQRRPAIISGEYLSDSQCILYGPSTEHFTDLSDRGGGMQLFFPNGMLEQAIAARLQNDPMSLASKRKPLELGRASMQCLRQLVVDLTQFADDNASEGREHLCQRTFNHQTLMKTVVDHISETLCRDQTLASDALHPRVPPRCLLTRVRDIFDASGRKPIYLYELCQELGVSARTLQVTFKQAYGISPMRYLKLRRLHSAREHLFTTSAEDVSIKRAALENGFFGRSRFAEDFKKLFGHLPSETPRA